MDWTSVYTSGNWQGEIWNRKKNGEIYQQRLTINAVSHENESLIKYVGIFSDISEEKQDEDYQRLHAKVFENADEGIMITDMSGTILSVNPAFSLVTGFTWAEAVGQTPKILNSGRQDAEFYDHMWASIRAKGNWRGEIWNRKKNGEYYLEWLSINAVRDDDEIIQYIGIFYDITERKQSEERLEFLAHYDVLTSLPNRTLFHDRLNQAILYADRHQTEVTLMFIDLDRFKLINDTLGHSVGDKALQRVADCLISCVRKSDTVARLSGDEFTVILPFCNDREAVVVVAQKILDCLAESYLIGDHEIFTAASIGIAVYPQDCQDAENLIKHADWAMYRAKSSRSGYFIFSDEMQEPITRRMMLENDLRHALVNGELFVYYQPQFSMLSRRISGIEALIRWKHPKLGFVPPNEFISIAEETGQILRIGEWVIQTVCKQNKAWQVAGIPCVKISVNLSVRQIEDMQFTDRLQDILTASGLDPKYLVVEITESVSIYNVDSIFQKLNVIQSMGIEISIDDFGTGHSSLSYLQRYPLNVLKLDKSFIDGIDLDPKNETIVKAIIDLACGLELQVIAEGVETQEQLNVLMRLGCHTIQGYLFSAPIPVGEMEAKLKDYF